MSALRSATKEKGHVAKMQHQQDNVTHQQLRKRPPRPAFTRPRCDSRVARAESYSWQSYYYTSESSSSDYDDDDDDDKSDHSWQPKDDLEEILLSSLQNFNIKKTSDRLYNRSSSSGRGQKKTGCKFHRNGNTCPRCEQDVLPHQLGDFKDELSVLRQALLGTSASL